MDAAFGSWGTQTFIAGLIADATSASWAIQGAMDGTGLAASMSCGKSLMPSTTAMGMSWIPRLRRALRPLARIVAPSLARNHRPQTSPVPSDRMAEATNTARVRHLRISTRIASMKTVG